MIEPPRPFCASCLADDVELLADVVNGRRVKLCEPCQSGDLRGGRWSFNDSGEERRPAKPKGGGGKEG